jgi:hypothetical protein
MLNIFLHGHMAPEVLKFLWVPAIGAYEEEQIFEAHKQYEIF